MGLICVAIFSCRFSAHEVPQCRQYVQGTVVYGRRADRKRKRHHLRQRTSCFTPLRSPDLAFPEDLTELLNVQEIKFGDNDTLSAITSSMVHADYLFLLTDVDGLYLSNPRKDPDAKFLEVVSSVAEARLEGREPTKTLLSIISSPSFIHSWCLFHRLACFVLHFIHAFFSFASLHNPADLTKLN